jgi:hypothetical protein
MFLWLLSFLRIVGRPRREKKRGGHKSTCGAPIIKGAIKGTTDILAVGHSGGVAVRGINEHIDDANEQNHRPVHLKVHQSERPETAADGKRDGVAAPGGKGPHNLSEK